METSATRLARDYLYIVSLNVGNVAPFPGQALPVCVWWENLDVSSLSMSLNILSMRGNHLQTFRKQERLSFIVVSANLSCHGSHLRPRQLGSAAERAWASWFLAFWLGEQGRYYKRTVVRSVIPLGCSAIIGSCEQKSCRYVSPQSYDNKQPNSTTFNIQR